MEWNRMFIVRKEPKNLTVRPAKNGTPFTLAPCFCAIKSLTHCQVAAHSRPMPRGPLMCGHVAFPALPGQSHVATCPTKLHKPARLIFLFWLRVCMYVCMYVCVYSISIAQAQNRVHTLFLSACFSVCLSQVCLFFR